MSIADGTITITGDTALVAFERRLRHPIDTVWAAITDPEQLGVWLGPTSLEPHTGGQFSARTGPDDHPERQRTMSGRVLVWDPPHTLEHEWSQPGIDLSIVRYELEPDRDETILRFTHRRGLTPGAIGGRAGWHAYLDRLAAHLGHQPVPAWSQRRAAIENAYGEAPIR